jgi:prolyl-tRNA synthetase
MDYTPVKGCMVIRPTGYALWEAIHEGLDTRFKATGHVNAYFPLFIPQEYLRRESEHFEGFTPEVAWVTRGGGEELAEPLAVRPTSEAIIGPIYAKWIQSYRDLPLLINQWCNVVRWEKATRPFIRTTEFLWQEGHTCHRTEAEAEEEVLRILEIYREFIEESLAIPVIPGLKSESEKFAGAQRTYSIEALMSDGRALQAGTSHHLGQHFAKVFGINFLDQDGQLKPVWQTSWGVTTRLIGAIVMVHGDDRGLVLPPRVAPVQVVVVPIPSDTEPDLVAGGVASVRRALEMASGLGPAAGRAETPVRFKIDERSEYTPGWKYNDWEMRGVPLRLEVGPRDVKAGQVVAVRRDTGEKLKLPSDPAVLSRSVSEILASIQGNLYDKARRFRNEHTYPAGSLGEIAAIMEGERGFVLSPWCGSADCEREVKDKTGATLRCLPLPGRPAPLLAEGEARLKLNDRCALCGGQARHLAYFARAY